MRRSAFLRSGLGLTLGAVLLVGCGGQRIHQLNEYALDLAGKGQWEEARFYWAKALELDARDPALLNNMAVYLEQENRFTEARECYRRALEAGAGSVARKNLRHLEELLEDLEGTEYDQSDEEGVP